jgi:hypothetical protein
VRYTPMRHPPNRCTLVGYMPVRYVLIFENRFVVLDAEPGLAGVSELASAHGAATPDVVTHRYRKSMRLKNYPINPNHATWPTLHDWDSLGRAFLSRIDFRRTFDFRCSQIASLTVQQ